MTKINVVERDRGREEKEAKARRLCVFVSVLYTGHVDNSSFCKPQNNSKLVQFNISKRGKKGMHSIVCGSLLALHRGWYRPNATLNWCSMDSARAHTRNSSLFNEFKIPENVINNTFPFINSYPESRRWRYSIVHSSWCRRAIWLVTLCIDLNWVSALLPALSFLTFQQPLYKPITSLVSYSVLAHGTK